MVSERTLGDIAEIVMGQSPAGETCNDSGEGLPLLNGPTEFGPNHPFPVQYTSDPKKHALPGDLLFCVRGSTTGRMNWADRHYAIGRGIAAIRGKNGYPNSFVKGVIENELPTLLAIATGSTFPNVGKDMISGILAPQIDVSESREISSVLDCLDDKISLLRESNTTLEAIAQALFKSWFVDFHPVRAKSEGRDPEGVPSETADLFPSDFEDSELGEIPKGWEIRTIGDLTDRVGMGPFGSNIKVSTFLETGVPVLNGQHIRETLLEDSSFNFISEEHANRLSGSVVSAGDIVITHRGTLGQVSLIPGGTRFDKYVLSQSQFFVRCSPKMIPPSWMIYFLRSATGQHRLLANSSQVGVPSISRPVSYLRTIKVVVPPLKINLGFDRIIQGLHKRTVANRSEIRSISEIKEMLLPRFMSGKVRMPSGKEVAT